MNVHFQADQLCLMKWDYSISAISAVRVRANASVTEEESSKDM